MKAIEFILTCPEANSEENLAVTENALITLGFVSLLQSKDAAHVTKFCESLPLKGEDEAKEAHALLFNQMIAGNFCGAKDQMSKAVLAIKQAVEHNSELIEESDVALMNQAAQL